MMCAGCFLIYTCAVVLTASYHSHFIHVSLCSIPLWEGCLVTGVDTFTFLFLESYGVFFCTDRDGKILLNMNIEYVILQFKLILFSTVHA